MRIIAVVHVASRLNRRLSAISTLCELARVVLTVSMRSRVAAGVNGQLVTSFNLFVRDSRLMNIRFDCVAFVIHREFALRSASRVFRRI